MTPEAGAPGELVHSELRGVMALLTLDSPHNRNALSRRLLSDLLHHLRDAAEDPSVRVVGITGTGTTFCSGADLTDPPVDSGAESLPTLLRYLWEYPKPVIAGINGHVRAGGFGLVCCSDIAVSAESASFALSEVRLGLVPAVISVPLLRRMSPAAARRYLLTGERFGAREAAGAGLVVSVVPDETVLTELDALGEEFRACEPDALRATRELIRLLPEIDPAEGFSHAARVSAEFFGCEAAREGIAAFRGRRQPRWAAPD